MKTDYITNGSALPPYLAYPRFLLGMNIRLTAKEIYAIMLDMILNSETAQTDKRGRRYLAFYNKTIAEIIDRTPSTVAQSLRELEDVGLVEKKLIALHTPLSHLHQVTRRRGHTVIVHMNYQQYRTARRLVHSCCNYDCGNCLLLDDGEECVCPQSITYSLVCRWFRTAVLPLDAGLCATLLHRADRKKCALCGGYYLPKSNRAKYCPECATAARRKKEAERQRRRYYVSTHLGSKKP